MRVKRAETFVTSLKGSEARGERVPSSIQSHLEGRSSLLCLASAMFPPLVQFSGKDRRRVVLWRSCPLLRESRELTEPGAPPPFAVVPLDPLRPQCRVKLLCLLYTVLIVKSLLYCCGLALLMSLRNKGRPPAAHKLTDWFLILCSLHHSSLHLIISLITAQTFKPNKPFYILR
ncbi:hypothetical protein INR49_010250 [Caranx melampygus]|nr:hypothetical protein INR49_010250 [Caranx melampygus]